MDSVSYIVACMQASIDDLELEHRDETAIRNTIGLGLREVITTLFPDGDEELVGHMVMRYRYHYLQANDTETPLFTGAYEVLEQLSELGYLLAIATGKGRNGLDKALRASNTAEFFHATRCADETHSKPHPQMLLELTETLGVEPRDTLLIGDSEYDILMAKNAGAAALAVSYGVHDLPRLMQHEPLGAITSIKELPDWLVQQRGG